MAGGKFRLTPPNSPKQRKRSFRLEETNSPKQRKRSFRLEETNWSEDSEYEEAKKDMKKTRKRNKVKRARRTKAKGPPPIVPLDDGDFITSVADFSVWLLTEKNKLFEELNSEKQRKYFSKYVMKYNEGSLTDEYYSGKDAEIRKQIRLENEAREKGMEPSTPPPETKVNTEDFELGPLPYVEPLKLLEVEGYDDKRDTYTIRRGEKELEDWRAEVDKRYQRKHRDVIDPRDEYEKEKLELAHRLHRDIYDSPEKFPEAKLVGFGEDMHRTSSFRERNEWYKRQQMDTRGRELEQRYNRQQHIEARALQPFKKLLSENYVQPEL